MRHCLHLVYPAGSHAWKITGTIWPTVSGPRTNPPSARELPPAAPRQRGSASILADAQGPSRGGRPHPAWLRPTGALTWALAGRRAPCRQPHGVRPPPLGQGRTAPLPVSAFRTQDPPSPTGWGCPHTRLSGSGEEGRKGNEKRGREKRCSVVRGSPSDGGQGVVGFGQSPSPALSQALARAVAEYWCEVLRAGLEANGPTPAFLSAGGRLEGSCWPSC